MSAGIRLRPGNPMIMVVRATLAFEAVAVGLSIPVMTQVSHRDLALALPSAGVVVLLALASAGTIKRIGGWVAGWLAQIGAILLGLLTPGMFAVGALFAVLFIAAFVLGRRLESRQPA